MREWSGPRVPYNWIARSTAAGSVPAESGVLVNLRRLYLNNRNSLLVNLRLLRPSVKSIRYLFYWFGGLSVM